MLKISLKYRTFCVLFCFGFLLQSASGGIIIVKDGKPSSEILTTAEDTLERPAHMLSQYIASSSGVVLEVVNTSSGKYPVTIHVGNTSFVKGLNLNTDKMDDDGFIIAFPDAKNIVIVGRSDYGTYFGVCDFLERYVGVRWLFPGELGEYIPEYESLEIPATEIRSEPAFYSRLFSGLKGNQNVWAKRNRMHGRVNFHHNLLHLFPPETYTKTHPEFFPVVNGKRRLPPSNTYDIHNCPWHPCYSAEGLAEEGVKNICAYFSDHPEATSYSLGINDYIGECECEQCAAITKNEINGVGRINYSDLYYKWCNEVVKGVLEKYPDKYFGLLAYSSVYEPPSDIKLSPRIVPYLTYERLKWADSNIEAKGHRLTEKWQKSATTLGWYDYIYGDVGRPQHDHYLVPRVWFHLMAEYYCFGYNHGVRCLYAEAYPHMGWRDGPKLYLSLKLQWDPSLSVDKTLKEWYECTVGKKAAPYLAEYFSFWERYWTEKIPESEWFKKDPLRQYQNFDSEDYLAPLSANDLAECEELLKSTVKNAGTEKEIARAKYFLDSYRTWSKQVMTVISAPEFIIKNDPDLM